MFRDPEFLFSVKFHQIGLGIIALSGILLAALSLTSPLYAADTQSELEPDKLLRQAAQKWRGVNDYQALIHQTETHPNGMEKERWAVVTLIKKETASQSTKPRPNIQKGPVELSLFRVDFFEQEVSWKQLKNGVVQNATPQTIHFSDSSEQLYTYKPDQNSLTINWLDENAPIEEFLYLAGFAQYNIEQFFEEILLDPQVWRDTIYETPTYRMKMLLKQKAQEVVPPRFIWLTQETLMPKRFSVEGSVAAHFDFIDWKIDQNLHANNLIPQVPRDVFLVDHTQR